MRVFGGRNPGTRGQAVERLAGAGDVHRVSRDRGLLRANAFGGQELLLESDLVARVAGERARRADDAVAGNPLPIVIPCHRVIGTSGALTGYAGGRGLSDLAGEACV